MDDDEKEKFANALDIEYTQLFQTEHLQDRDVLLCKITNILENATDNDLKIIYKLICGYIN